MIEWDFFQKRRNIDLSVWIVEFNIENYDQLKELCASKGVKPPPFALFQAAQAVAMPTVGDLLKESVETPPKPKKVPAKPKRRRTTRKKATK